MIYTWNRTTVKYTPHSWNIFIIMFLFNYYGHKLSLGILAIATLLVNVKNDWLEWHLFTVFVSFLSEKTEICILQCIEID